MSDPEEWFDDAEQYVTNAKTLRDVDDRERMVQLQQAAEYALKGTMIERTGTHRRGHDLTGLGNEVGSPSCLDSTLAYLEQVYNRRYPDERAFSTSDFDERLSDVQDLIRWAKEV